MANKAACRVTFQAIESLLKATCKDIPDDIELCTINVDRHRDIVELIVKSDSYPYTAEGAEFTGICFQGKDKPNSPNIDTRGGLITTMDPVEGIRGA